MTVIAVVAVVAIISVVPVVPVISVVAVIPIIAIQHRHGDLLLLFYSGIPAKRSPFARTAPFLNPVAGGRLRKTSLPDAQARLDLHQIAGGLMRFFHPPIKASAAVRTRQEGCKNGCGECHHWHATVHSHNPARRMLLRR